MEDHQRHTNPQFEAELNGLRDALLKMGALVQVQIARAIEALVNTDSAKARETIARDVEVNRLDIDTDERCIRLLALYQPAAGDLRLITTGLKITTDLERIGDNAVNICERVLEFNQHPVPSAYIDVPRMGAVAQSMVQDSLDAFTRGDAMLAEQVIARDDEVDSLDDEICRQLLGFMAQNPEAIPRATPILFVSKYLERIADHATNIAEMVVFLVKGRDIRHMDKRHQNASALR
jgi:phosphate transport system protein